MKNVDTFQLQDSVKDNKVIELKSTLIKARKLIEYRRKLGYDTYLSELLLTYVLSYIQTYDASGNIGDYHKCVILFNGIDSESKIEELKFVDITD